MLSLVTSPWLADPDVVAPGTVRALVRESWSRSQQSQLDPERLLSPLLFESDELSEYREAHPLAGLMPVIRKLLVRDADNDSGMLVAVGDAMGRLLWVEGDQGLKSRAESMMFVEGADWSESVAGTSAPGTALALDHAIQIRQDEHFNQLVHAWSCTAVPVHDPETRNIIGVIDITGGDQAVDRHTMPLMEATAQVIETELMLQRVRERHDTQTKENRLSRFVLFDSLPSAAKNPAVPPTMQILGRDTALISNGGESIELSARHAEIMTLLAWNQSGLSAERLAELVWGSTEATGKLRAEMVRLRKILERFQPGLAPESKPYRLEARLEVDAQQVVALLDRGAHRAALAAYRGPLLPDSQAPGIEELRIELSDHLKESLLSDASVEVLLEYAHSEDAVDDLDVWTEILRLLPPKSPRRAGVVAHIERLQSA
jgi:transcriptional regulator of acetoin/glycerol metabolism